MTAQALDFIVYEGKKPPLISHLLESYFGADNPGSPLRLPHMANWRGYVATWEAGAEKLYLTDITAWLREADDVFGLDDLFPGEKGRTFASWFSGRLRGPKGEILEYVHMGYDSVCERELFLTVEDGGITGSRLIETVPNTTPGGSRLPSTRDPRSGTASSAVGAATRALTTTSARAAERCALSWAYPPRR